MCRLYSRVINYVLFISDINECDSSPCRNEATCNNLLNAYNCTCPPGYTGTNCETGIYTYYMVTLIHSMINHNGRETMQKRPSRFLERIKDLSLSSSLKQTRKDLSESLKCPYLFGEY